MATIAEQIASKSNGTAPVVVEPVKEKPADSPRVGKRRASNVQTTADANADAERKQMALAAQRATPVRYAGDEGQITAVVLPALHNEDGVMLVPPLVVSGDEYRSTVLKAWSKSLSGEITALFRKPRK